MINIKLKRIGTHTLPLPNQSSASAAGCDLRAQLEKCIVLEPGQWKLLATGFAMELPAGYEAQVRPRSGLALKHGITVLNSPGTIDSDYRGEIGVILINHGEKPHTIEPGDRIAQMVISQVIPSSFSEVANLEDSERGQGGFGSTGSQ